MTWTETPEGLESSPYRITNPSEGCYKLYRRREVDKITWWILLDVGPSLEHVKESIFETNPND